MQWRAPRLKFFTSLIYLLILAAVMAVCVVMASNKKTDVAVNALGTWEAEIDVNGLKLELLMHVNNNGLGKLAGSIDSPAQNAFGMMLSDIEHDDLSLSYQVSVIGASYRGAFNTNTSAIEGIWKQGGVELVVNWVRQGNKNNDPEPLRPQTPVAPFTYDSIEYSFQSSAREIVLSGTLTLPSTMLRSPGVVLISGSGPQDRDSKISSHSVFWVVSDMLTRHGFAVLRYDDRGVGKSQGEYDMATTYDFAEDAIGAAKAISHHPLVDENRITYIGLSEGGVIAAIAKNRGSLASEIVMLSPPILAYSDLSVQQAYDITLSTGAGKDVAERAAEDQQAIMDAALAAIKKNGSMKDAVEEKLLQMGFSSDSANREAQPFDSVWLNTFIQLDPYDKIKNVDVPILAIWGDKDVQVNANKNFKKMSSLSSEQSIDAMVFPDLNHLLQPATTGAVSEYASIDVTISDEVIEKIVEWIQLQHN
jgi:pimeloyl-ACP methyl ester carboxylesterase